MLGTAMLATVHFVCFVCCYMLLLLLLLLEEWQ